MPEHRNVLAVTTYADALREHLHAIASRDIDAFARTVHPDVRLIGPSGSIIEGRENAVAAHRTWFAEPEWLFEPSIVFSDGRANSAWSLASVKYTERGMVNRFLLFMLFVGTERGTWELIYDQNTPLT